MPTKVSSCNQFPHPLRGGSSYDLLRQADGVYCTSTHQLPLKWHVASGIWGGNDHHRCAMQMEKKRTYLMDSTNLHGQFEVVDGGVLSSNWIRYKHTCLLRKVGMGTVSR